MWIHMWGQVTIVQAHDEPRVEPEEFARVLKDGSSMAVAAS